MGDMEFGEGYAIVPRFGDKSRQCDPLCRINCPEKAGAQKTILDNTQRLNQQGWLSRTLGMSSVYEKRIHEAHVDLDYLNTVSMLEQCIGPDDEGNCALKIDEVGEVPAQ